MSCATLRLLVCALILAGGPVLAAGDAAPSGAPASGNPLSGAPVNGTPNSDVPATARTSSHPGSRCACIPIEGMIDHGKAVYLRRAMAEAISQKVDTVLIHLTTNGGELGAALDMADTLLSVPADGPRLVAYVDVKAWSAGAMIAYSTQQIYLSDRAEIGDIGVITMDANGKIEYLPEKINTAVRAHLRGLAQKRGWNEAKLVKMTALDQDLYRFELKHGPVFVIEDDLPAFLADHPTLSSGDKVLISGHDRLMSYTGPEAVREGMATALVADQQEVYRLLGTKADAVVDLAPTRVEEVSWLLSGWAPLMAAGAVLFLVLEFKAPMGLWAVLATGCGIAFFVCQYYQDLANYIDVVLVVLGVACVVVELFLMHTGGLLALGGLALGMTGLVLSFMPTAEQFHPSAPGWNHDLLKALGDSTLSFIAAAAGVVTVVMYLPKMRLFRRLAVSAEITATSESTGTEPAEASTALVGRRGHARTELRPSGFVAFADQDLSATTEHGEFIPQGATVEVVEVRFGETIVRQIAAPVGAGPAP
jgi:membrane-bound serine protease (ClpP class)